MPQEKFHNSEPPNTWDDIHPAGGRKSILQNKRLPITREDVK